MNLNVYGTCSRMIARYYHGLLLCHSTMVDVSDKSGTDYSYIYCSIFVNKIPTPLLR